MHNTGTALRIINAALKKVKEDSYCLVYAVDILKPEPAGEEMRCMVSTDGERLFFKPKEVIKNYRCSGIKTIEEDIFHIILHGILGHFGMTEEYRHCALAGYVMDLQIEQIMEELGMDRLERYRHKPDWYKTMGFSLYNAALRDKELARNVCREGEMRRTDDHLLWWSKKTSGENSVIGMQTSTYGLKEVALKWANAGKYLTGNEMPGEKDACLITERLRETGKAFKKSGMNGGYGKQCFKPEGERQSFSQVLCRFMHNRTISREQPDFIDPMIYEYGLSIYGNVPLIEPPEELEKKILKNLVIGIDTSGSCQEYTGRFLNQLVGIFEEAASEFRFEKIYVIQCDAKIHSVTVFDRIEELGSLNGQAEFEGFGGTDFCPVFDWIDKNIIEKGDSADCLLYFSDAEGVFPKEKKGYPVIFVLPESRYADNRRIPGWIEKAVLDDSLTKR